MDGESIVIEADGTVRFVYSDALHDLVAPLASEFDVRRASHVEPASAFGWECDGWLADMRPVKGPLLHDGYEPGRPGVKRAFATRAAALQAERDWLREEQGL